MNNLHKLKHGTRIRLTSLDQHDWQLKVGDYGTVFRY